MLSQGASILTITRDAGLPRQTIYCIKADPVEAEAILLRWAA
ncbi:hypothetical protein ACQVP2_30480 [Methylobacterium aquaticum]